jgi:cellobiose phosphorylase
MPQSRFPYSTPFGQFAEDGASYRIARPGTPRPWSHVLSTGSYGVKWDTMGEGHSWLVRPGGSAFPVTLNRAVYLRDEKSKKYWSAARWPVTSGAGRYEGVHGMGFTLFQTDREGIHTHWFAFTPHEENAEVWRLRIKNTSTISRVLTVWTWLDWAFSPAQGSEAEGGRILAVRPLEGGRQAPGALWHAVNSPVRSACFQREAFWGGGSAASPDALKKGRYDSPSRGRRGHGAGLLVPVTLKPGEEKSLIFSIGAAGSRAEAMVKARKFQDFSQLDSAWGRTEMFWDRFLTPFRVETPEPSFNLAVNNWSRYAALTEGVWGRDATAASRLESGALLAGLDPESHRAEILNAIRAGVSGPALARAVALHLRETGREDFLAEKVDVGAGRKKSIGDFVKKELKGAARNAPEWGNALAELARLCVPGKERALEAKYRSLCPALDRTGRVAPYSTVGEPAAYFRFLTEGLLGLRAEPGGLRVRPCFPPGWKSVSCTRVFRGGTYRLRFRRDESLAAGTRQILFNNRRLEGDLLPPSPEQTNEALVSVGPAPR